MGSKLLGVGHYLPERVVANEEIASLVGVSADWIERVTGVRQRHRVTDETTVEMAARAAEHALQHAGIALPEIDVLISASAGRQQTIPCTAAFIHRRLGLPNSTFAFDLDVTCLGFLAALHVADSLLDHAQYQNVLIVSSELGSETIDYSQPESAVLFGDAAAAAVVTKSNSQDDRGIKLARFHTVSEGVELAQIRGGGTLHHPNHAQTTSDMNLFQMRGPEIFKLATRHMGKFLDLFFNELEWCREDVDFVVPHQASRMATRQLTKRYGFECHQILENLALRGNCVAASLPLMLSEAVHDGRIQRDQQLLLVGTGAGLTLGAIAMIY